MKIERNKNLDEKKPRNGIKIESRKERIIKILQPANEKGSEDAVINSYTLRTKKRNVKARKQQNSYIQNDDLFIIVHFFFSLPFFYCRFFVYRKISNRGTLIMEEFTREIGLHENTGVCADEKIKLEKEISLPGSEHFSGS